MKPHGFHVLSNADSNQNFQTELDSSHGEDFRHRTYPFTIRTKKTTKEKPV